MVIVSGRLDLPWDAPLFTEAAAGADLHRLEAEPPRPRPAQVVRHEGAVDLVEALRHLRQSAASAPCSARAGPRLHGEMQARAWPTISS